MEPCLENATSKIDFTPSIVTKLEAFPKLGNATNANIDAKPKEISFLELFKEWELKKQQQLQQLVTTTAYPSRTSILPFMTLDGSGTDHMNTIPGSGLKSILRRRNIAEDDGAAVVPKKRVRFATIDGVDSDLDFIQSNFNGAEGGDAAGKDKEVENDTFLAEENMPLFNGDTETIEIFSNDEAVTNENKKEHDEETSVQKIAKPNFDTAKKLLKKAKLQGSQRQDNVQALSGIVAEKPTIEIQECRIIKPAGTKLPTVRFFKVILWLINLLIALFCKHI